MYVHIISYTMDKITSQAKELYDEYRFGDFNYGQKRASTEPLLMKFLTRVTKEETLFDIGCGTGFWIDLYLGSGVSRGKLTLLDLSPVNIDRIKNNGFSAYCGSVMKLPFEDNAANFTICNGVIHHTPAPEKAFAELVRITKPGGYIYLNVYNKWNPYFYIVYKATFPIRYVYWNYSKRIVDFIYPLAKLFIQPLAYLNLGMFLDKQTAKIMFMDQVMTPRAYLFSKSKIRSYAENNGCNVEEFAYNKNYMMLAATIKVGNKQC